MSEEKIEVVEVEESVEQNDLTVKQYVYKKDGKEYKVVRKYSVKKSTSMKTKDNKQKVAEYIEEHKQKYLDTVSHKQVSTLIEDIKNDLGINVSYTGAYNLLIKHGVKIV